MDPYALLSKAEAKMQAMKYRHNYKLQRIEAKRLSELHLIAQLIGEGQPREKVRQEIIRMAGK